MKKRRNLPKKGREGADVAILNTRHGDTELDWPVEVVLNMDQNRSG